MEDERTSLQEDDMLFRDVMTSPAVTIAPDLSLRRVAQLLDRLVTGVPGMTAVRFR
jgi:CBS domain-containing protein